MAHEIKEYVGCKDDIGEGLHRIWLKSEEIIRCRDCKNFIPNQECHFFNNAFIDPNGFCAWAERSE